MSRYTFETKGCFVVVGWDDPMRTFFAQVWPPNAEAEDLEPLLWVGLSYGEIQTVEDLAERVRPYAKISSRIRGKLREDFANRQELTEEQVFAREAFYGKPH